MGIYARRVNAGLIVCVLVSYSSSAQMERQKSEISDAARENASQDKGPASSETVSPDDGLSVIAAALDSRIPVRAKRDCSHLVHAIYDRAGFPYSYVSSFDLYVGSPEFERVAHPQPGDLVVWRGHAGIVVNPVQHVFFSAMRSGPGIDTYDAPYWKRRGPVRFYRYIKGSPSQNASHARGRVLPTRQVKEE